MGDRVFTTPNPTHHGPASPIGLQPNDNKEQTLNRMHILVASTTLPPIDRVSYENHYSLYCSVMEKTIVWPPLISLSPLLFPSANLAGHRIAAASNH